MERAAIGAFYPCVMDRLKALEQKVGQEWGWGANRRTRSMKVEIGPVCVDCDSKNIEVA